MTVHVLEQEMFTEAEAARLLNVAQATLNYWLEGGQRGGKIYEPIIREAPHGRRAPVTWAEFVKAGWLKQFRRDRNVPMRELRAVISKLRDEFQVPYPLAHFQPFANEKQLIRVARVQDHAGLTAEFCAVGEVHNQLVMLPPTKDFASRIDWEDGLALGWRPAEDPRSNVRMHPAIRFGRPAVGGISTEVLWEQLDAGASIAEVAADVDLSERDVKWAAPRTRNGRRPQVTRIGSSSLATGTSVITLGKWRPCASTTPGWSPSPAAMRVPNSINSKC